MHCCHSARLYLEIAFCFTAVVAGPEKKFKKPRGMLAEIRDFLGAPLNSIVHIGEGRRQLPVTVLATSPIHSPQPTSGHSSNTRRHHNASPSHLIRPAASKQVPRKSINGSAPGSPRREPPTSTMQLSVSLPPASCLPKRISHCIYGLAADEVLTDLDGC